MARRTRRDSFRELVSEAQQNIPDLNMTSDVIVGFPGETDDEFQQTLDFVAEIGFSRLHAFTYSQRPGTAAATMPNQIDGGIKKERMHRLLAQAKEQGETFHGRYQDKTVNVLWESVTGADQNGLKWAGYTDNYIRVQGSGPADIMNKMTPTKITETDANGLRGQALMPS